MSSSYASSSKPKRRNSIPDKFIDRDQVEDYGQMSKSTGSVNTSNLNYQEPVHYDNKGTVFSSSAVATTTSSGKSSSSGHLPGQQDFAEKCQAVQGLLTGTKTVLENLRETNNARFVIQYPFLYSNENRKPERTQSFSGKAPVRRVHKRTNSLTGTFNLPQISNFQLEIQHRLLTPEDAQESNSSVNVLKLDMKSAEMSAIKKDSIAELLNVQIGKTLNHLQNLSARIADKSSKVLVAGDLNAGKSTFVNALLRKGILPVDQQPCTTLFCEVLDARENGGREAVHGIKDIKAYNVNDPTTYTIIDFEHLERVVSDNTEGYALLKIYCQDNRLSHESLLHNGVVDIALIDCPGLNSDSLKTMAVFARQEEIDVIVFVVSAENHFTLSANQFLWNASNEKAYLFIVVNKFDEIKNKEKCRRMILEQIKQISPRTFEYHDDLVHFVSSNAINVDGNPPHTNRIPEVDHLEESLRTFVLKKRSKSKLAPAGHYLHNLLYDIGVLAEFNRELAAKEYEQLTRELEEGEPAFRKLQRDGSRVVEEAERLLNEDCRYHGLLYVWNYAMELRDSMLEKIQNELSQCELSAKQEVSTCIEQIQAMPVQNISIDPIDAKLDKYFTNRNNNPIQIHIDPSDFFDLNLGLDLNHRMNENVGILGISGGALVMFGGKFLGYNVMSSVLKISNVVGFNNMRKLALPLIGLAGLGFFVYVVSDARNAVSRNVARKVRSHLTQSNYAEFQAHRIAYHGRKATRRSINYLRDCFRRAIDAEEQKRKEQREKAKVSDESKFYFGGVLSKAEEMSKVLEVLGIDVVEDEILAVH
ncbi:13148_t:CDS:2 [Ambispora gerdemannii]|uniref:13148_t:CDS:1 n=1 Tax=Ambispora gerdemannii TaxID=144530 RepID=A0A9N9C8I4_9GLOM|nr:13148_t:CDS:2 [Ambispora gerdemannii]